MRFPYFIAMNIWHIDYCEAYVYTLPKEAEEDPEEMFGKGLSTDFVEFFIEHGHCAECGSAVPKKFCKCGCSNPSDDVPYVIKYPTKLDQSHYKNLYARERSRVRAYRRTQMIKENGGKFDKKHIKGMHKAQRGLCYYCGTPIELGSKSFHADHYLPLAEGGMNDLDNMVLTCAKCNLLKNSMDGDRFDARARKFRTPEFTAVLRAIRRDLRAYKKAEKLN